MNLFNRILLFTISVFTLQSYASTGTDVGVFFGIKNAEFDTDSSGVDFKSDMGLVGGVLAYGEMGGLFFRTGGYYAERKTELSTGTTKADLKVASLDVPLTLMYSFNDMFSVFGGATVSLKLSDDCSGAAAFCNTNFDANSMLTSATIGVNAKFHPNWSGEIFYEYGLSDIAEDTSVNAISAGAIFIY